MSLAPEPRHDRPDPTDDDPQPAEPPKVWAVRLNGQTIEVRDLPLGVLNDIAHEHSASWVRVVGAPVSDLGIAEAVLRAVALQVGYMGLPDPMTPRALFDGEYFFTVEDDIPLSEDEAPSDPPSGAAS